MKKNILKIAAATASAIITLAFLSCTQEGNVYNYNYTSTAPKAVTNVKATRIGESTVRLSWTAPKDNNIHAFYVGGTVAAKGDFAALDPDTVPVGQTYYNFKYAHQGFEWQFSVQTVSYDGTYSKPVTVTNSDVLSNSIYLKTVQNNPNSVKVYVAVSDVDNVGIEKVCCYMNYGYQNNAEYVILNGTPISPDSDGYYSFDATKNGNYSFAAELSNGTFIGPQNEFINTVSIK